MSEWKVDPDNRRRLLQLQKLGANKKCVDCGAPNPQWASPKFGVFICLECAGIHRSLGVHISFVRSITMDQFKPEELVRMEKGGNEAFEEYMSSHNVDLSLPHKAKYDNPIAEDYKRKLTCEVTGEPFTEAEHPDFDPASLANQQPEVKTAAAGVENRQQTPIKSRRSATPKSSLEQRTRNETFFEEMGKKNQSKPENLPPSQGGKYQGFGNTPVNDASNGNGARGQASNTLSLDNFQKDPLGTFAKGWGLFSSAVTKSFEEVNESVIKPGYQQWQSGELSEDTRRAAAQFGQKVQETSHYGMQAFSSFTKNMQQHYMGDNLHENSPYSHLSQVDSQEGLANDQETYAAKSNEKSKKPAADEWDEF
ncbi:hypothetical protein HG536_0D00630 [Torulaspora globosa]|uniref:Arf-GAP domain-containing protein n=1 Tax=Torulaspora globosa TaxID=48254 RepID=A0A7G3ZGA5_9SACH|nr:uncharacterized protein HG536_0D00630 [Torulaspora globosa]QLL32541.1 hypothetical protein HG536_0D00630 [Torulaspora globosa]